MTNHDISKLIGCHPDLISRVDKVINAMIVLGFVMEVTDGLRTVDQQKALFAQGRSVPGLIVTMNDGVTHPSNHQAKVDGFGHACDCCFLVDDKPSWDARLPWKAYGACAEALGLKWGGSWKNFQDLPHIELA